MNQDRPTLSWYALGVVALAVCVRAPVLGAGFVSDDHVLIAAIEGRSPLANTPGNLWTFYDGAPARQAKLVYGGGLPWWTEPTAAHAFFRPVSSGVLVALHSLFGRHAIGYYAFVLALCGCNVLLAGDVFRRLLPRPAAALALCLFAFHALHVDPTRWISAVHLLISEAAFLLGWQWFLRWRAEQWRAGPYLAAAAFVLALGGGEGGLGPLAYVFCHEVGSARRGGGRAVALAIPVLVATGYVALYRAFHFGAHAIDGYLDPGAAPGNVAAALADRVIHQVPQLLMAPVEGTLSEIGPAMGVVARSVLGVSVLLLVALAILLQPGALRACRAWVASAVLCALPGLLGPTERALYPATLGSSAVLGLLVASGWTTVAQRRLTNKLVAALAASSAAVVLFAQVALGAFSNFEGARAMAKISSDELRAVTSLVLPSPRDTDVVVLAADGPTTGPWGGVLYAFSTGTAPRSWQALALGPGPFSVGRVADDTLEMSPAATDGFAMYLYRDAEEHPMHVGDRIATRALAIEVTAVTGRGRPSRIRVRADRSLDDPSFCFATRTRERLLPVPLPTIGMGMWLP